MAKSKKHPKPTFEFAISYAEAKQSLSELLEEGLLESDGHDVAGRLRFCVTKKGRAAVHDAIGELPGAIPKG